MLFPSVQELEIAWVKWSAYPFVYHFDIKGIPFNIFNWKKPLSFHITGPYYEYITKKDMLYFHRVPSKWNDTVIRYICSRYFNFQITKWYISLPFHKPQLV